MALTTLQIQVLIGTLLGDAHLEVNGRYVRLKIDHAEEQADYVDWKHDVFQDISPQPPQSMAIYDKRNGTTSYHRRFSTYSLPDLVSYHQMFYLKGRKIVPVDIKAWLVTPVALAVWYMDDGARRTDCEAVRIHTNAYTVGEQNMLAETLFENFGVSVTRHRVRGEQYVLYIPSGEAERFCDIIRPFVVGSLRYKLL